VFLKLKPGRRLESEQTTAIQNLVASSIPELEAKQVTIIDQQGRLLSSPEGGDEFAAREKQMEIARGLEERYTQRIEQLLAPLVGVGRVRAQVVADVELSTTEEAREQYRPESQIVRSEQSAEENSRGGAGNAGVPGALTNQPPTPGVALPPNVTNATKPPVAGANGATVASATEEGPTNNSKQSTKNYEIDRTVAYTKQPAGRLKRLTVAVLVDNDRTTGADGKPSDVALTPERIENMAKLVKDAVGFDSARGDSVSVVNVGFKPEVLPEEIKPDEIPIWERPLIRDIAKLVGALIVLLVLVLSVLRPLVRGLLASPKPLLPIMRPVEANVAQPALPDGQTAALDYDAQIAQVRTLVSQDPARVAQVVKGWVGTDE
jgi:flagellar M-ring protein FliF